MGKSQSPTKLDINKPMQADIEELEALRRKAAEFDAKQKEWASKTKELEARLKETEIKLKEMEIKLADKVEISVIFSVFMVLANL